MKRNVYIFLGPPGSGKGTQTKKIKEELNLPHIDTGSLLRENVKNQTPFGIEAKKYMDKGQLVPSSIVKAIILNRLKEDDAKSGYILDGYPRSMEQAQILEEIHKELKNFRCDDGENIKAFYFDIDTEKLVSRLVNRRSCPKCGEIYNLLNKKPEKEGYCKCGEKLIQRSDDNEETARLRFETYNNETKPLLKYFSDLGVLINIDADKPIDDVYSELKKAIK